MEQAEKSQVMTKRGAMMDRMKGKYPDRNFDDEEEFFGAINDDYDDYDKQLNEYKDREGKFSEMFSSDPRSTKFLMSWKEGKDPAVELVRQFGTEIKDAIDDPERLDDIAAANKEFVDRVAQEKQLEDQYKQNVTESLAMIEKYQSEKGLTDEQLDNAMEWLIGVIRDGVLGKFSTESLDMAIKAINHDTDVMNAETEGEVRGKNTKIEEKLRKQSKGDGLPNLDGKNQTGTNKTVRRGIFGLADEAR